MRQTTPNRKRTYECLREALEDLNTGDNSCAGEIAVGGSSSRNALFVMEKHQ
jgi:hypothetical protein